MILNTKIQHINFGPGEFVDIKKRTYEETISCIDNFHWENERDHLQISLTNPYHLLIIIVFIKFTFSEVLLYLQQQ